MVDDRPVDRSIESGRMNAWSATSGHDESSRILSRVSQISRKEHPKLIMANYKNPHELRERATRLVTSLGSIDRRKLMNKVIRAEAAGLLMDAYIRGGVR